MAVTVDAVGPSSAGQTGAAVATSTWSHTVGAGSDRLIVAGVSLGYNTLTWPRTTATFAGLAMTSKFGRSVGESTQNGFCELFYLVNPPSGVGSLVLTLTGAADISAGSVSFAGVDQQIPLGLPVYSFAQSTAAAAVTLPSVDVGNMALDMVTAGSNLSANTQTLQWRRNTNQGTGGGNGCQTTAVGTGAAVTFGHTIAALDMWTDMAVEIFAAGFRDPALEGALNTSAMAAMTMRS